MWIHSASPYSDTSLTIYYISNSICLDADMQGVGKMQSLLRLGVYMGTTSINFLELDHHNMGGWWNPRHKSELSFFETYFSIDPPLILLAARNSGYKWPLIVSAGAFASKCKLQG